MADLGFEHTGYIIHEGPKCTFFLHMTPDDDTPTKLLYHFAEQPLHGFTLHVYQEPSGGRPRKKVLVIPAVET